VNGGYVWEKENENIGVSLARETWNERIWIARVWLVSAAPANTAATAPSTP